MHTRIRQGEEECSTKAAWNKKNADYNQGRRRRLQTKMQAGLRRLQTTVRLELEECRLESGKKKKNAD